MGLFFSDAVDKKYNFVFIYGFHENWMKRESGESPELSP